MTTLRPVRVEPATANASFWKRLHELRRIRHAELHPDESYRPDSLVEAILKRPDPFLTRDYYEIERDGQTLSLFYGQTVSAVHPGFASNKHLYWAEAYVRPDHRRQGIGARWLPVVAERMSAHGCTVLGIGTDHDEADNRLLGINADDHSARAFLSWLGAAPKLINVRSRLDIGRVDWRLVESWVREGQLRSPQARLQSCVGPLPATQWTDLAAQRSALLNTIPLEDLELGDIVITPGQLGESYARSTVVGVALHTVLCRDADGTISGITDVKWAPYAPRSIKQVFTGVLPRSRGRGIAKWLKAAMLLRLHAAYPQAQWIDTENAESNLPMLRINHAIGFRRVGSSIDYQISDHDLEAKIQIESLRAHSSG